MNLVFPLQRAFIALPLEENALIVYREIQDRLKDYGDFLRFQNPQSPHITMYYFGEMMEIEYGQMRERVGKIAAQTAPFVLQVSGAETFAGVGGGECVLHLGIDRSEALAQFKKLLPWPNLKPFSPHITLARMGNPQAFRVHRKKIMKLLEDSVFPITCDCVRFYAEIDGRRQAPIEDFLFGIRRDAF